MRRRTALGAATAAMALGGARWANPATTLRVMSYHTDFAGGMLEPPAPFEAMIEAIRVAGADIVGLQEIRAENPEGNGATAIGRSVAPRIAAALGWDLLEQEGHPEALWANAIVSRFPIRGATPAGLGAAINVAGRTVHLDNVHLPDAPYQPYSLLGVPYGDDPFISTEAGAIRFADQARGTGIRLLLEDLKAAAGSDAVFVTGDFNEPSHRDWTASPRRSDGTRSWSAGPRHGRWRRPGSSTPTARSIPTRWSSRGSPGPRPRARTIRRTTTTGSTSSWPAAPVWS